MRDIRKSRRGVADQIISVNDDWLSVEQQYTWYAGTGVNAYVNA